MHGGPRSADSDGLRRWTSHRRRIVSHHFIVVVTRSAASCWTKWPAPGTVTSVRSFATQSQVSVSASECSAVLEAVKHQHRRLDLREAGTGGAWRPPFG